MKKLRPAQSGAKSRSRHCAGNARKNGKIRDFTEKAFGKNKPADTPSNQSTDPRVIDTFARSIDNHKLKPSARALKKVQQNISRQSEISRPAKHETRKSQSRQALPRKPRGTVTEKTKHGAVKIMEDIIDSVIGRNKPPAQTEAVTPEGFRVRVRNGSGPNNMPQSETAGRQYIRMDGNPRGDDILGFETEGLLEQAKKSLSPEDYLKAENVHPNVLKNLLTENKLLHRVFITRQEELNPARARYFFDMLMRKQAQNEARTAQVLVEEKIKEIKSANKEEVELKTNLARQSEKIFNTVSKAITHADADKLAEITANLRKIQQEIHAQADARAAIKTFARFSENYQLNPQNLPALIQEASNYCENVICVPRKEVFKEAFGSVLIKLDQLLKQGKITFNAVLKYLARFKDPEFVARLTDRLFWEGEEKQIKRVIFRSFAYNSEEYRALKSVMKELGRINRAFKDRNILVDVIVDNSGMFLRDIRSFTDEEIAALISELQVVFDSQKNFKNTLKEKYIDYNREYEMTATPENPRVLKSLNKKRLHGYGEVRKGSFRVIAKTKRNGKSIDQLVQDTPERVIFSVAQESNGRYTVVLYRYFEEHGEYNDVAMGRNDVFGDVDLVYDAAREAVAPVLGMDKVLNKLENFRDKFLLSQEQAAKAYKDIAAFLKENQDPYKTNPEEFRKVLERHFSPQDYDVYVNIKALSFDFAVYKRTQPRISSGIDVNPPVKEAAPPPEPPCPPGIKNILQKKTKLDEAYCKREIKDLGVAKKQIAACNALFKEISSLARAHKNDTRIGTMLAELQRSLREMHYKEIFKKARVIIEENKKTKHAPPEELKDFQKKIKETPDEVLQDSAIGEDAAAIKEDILNQCAVEDCGAKIKERLDALEKQKKSPCVLPDVYLTQCNRAFEEFGAQIKNSRYDEVKDKSSDAVETLIVEYYTDVLGRMHKEAREDRYRTEDIRNTVSALLGKIPQSVREDPRVNSTIKDIEKRMNEIKINAQEEEPLKKASEKKEYSSLPDPAWTGLKGFLRAVFGGLAKDKSRKKGGR